MSCVSSLSLYLCFSDKNDSSDNDCGSTYITEVMAFCTNLQLKGLQSEALTTTSCSCLLLFGLVFGDLNYVQVTVFTLFCIICLKIFGI